MNMTVMFGVAGVVIIIGILIYVFVIAEKRDFPNNTARENIAFATAIFDNNKSYTEKIQDYDIFKYSGFDVKSPSYTYTNSKTSSNPYDKMSSTSANPDIALNSTIQPEDVAVDSVGAAVPTNDINTEDLTPSLSGLNANVESTIRESMVKSELRRMRK
jgi:hypothetical protein